VMWVMWNLISVRFEIVLVSVQDRCTVCVEHTTAQKSFWRHPMELLNDVRHVESGFGLFGDSASVSARYEHDLHQTFHRLRNHFGCTRWNSKVMWSRGMSFRCV
jgi:hypothetical protein